MGIRKTHLIAWLALIFSLSPAYADRIKLGLFNSIDSLDPAYCTGITCLAILNATSDPLVAIGLDNKIQPAGAQTWHIDEQQVTYTFNLRQDATWNDGNPVLARDYVTAFHRILDDTLDQFYRPTYLLGNIVNASNIAAAQMPPKALGIRAIDDWTLEIRLSSPASYFIHLLASPALSPVPTHIIEKKGNDWIHDRPLVSNGPFELTEATQTLFIMMARDNHWYKPKVESLSIRVMETEATVFELLAKNQLDIAFATGIEVDDWEVTRGFTERVASTFPVTALLTANVNRDTLSDLRVRQALHLLIDREKLASAMTSIPATSIVPQTFAGAASFAQDWLLESDYPARTLEARQLMDQAGYSDSNPLTLSLMYLDAKPNKALFNGIRSMVSTAYIELEEKKVPSLSFVSELDNADWDLSLIYWGADYPDAMTFLGIAQTDHGWNKGNWSHPEYDRLIAASLRAVDPIERANLYKKLNQILARELVMLPLFHQVSHLSYNSRLETPAVNKMGSFIRTLSLKNE